MKKIVYLAMALCLGTAFILDIIAEEKRTVARAVQQEKQAILNAEIEAAKKAEAEERAEQRRAEQS